MISGSLDPKNELSYLFAAAKSQANNTGGYIGDLNGFIGKVAVTVNIGVKTVGDADGAITIRAMTSATNNISNAVNYGTVTVTTSNNATASGQITVDTRDTVGRYLFYGVVVTGTNSPAFPIAVGAVGVKQNQGS